MAGVDAAIAGLIVQDVRLLLTTDQSMKDKHTVHQGFMTCEQLMMR